MVGDSPAVFGGVFDPIHFGHLFAAEAARRALGAPGVLFVPSGSAPHKEDEHIAAPRHRLEMVRRAVAGNEHFAVSDLETRREGPSYTVDTLRELGATPASPLPLILGVDAFVLIRTWMRWAEVLELSRLVIVSRPGHSDAEARELARELGVRPAAWIEPLGVAVSSTEIRERLRAGLPVRYLVPDEVLGYIAEQGLYGPEPV